MTIDTFWQMIDDARRAAGRIVELPQGLIDVLCRLDEREIVEYQAHYLDCLFRAYDAKLWLAAGVIMGGCGDDTFSDFRGWLIAQGRGAYESALVDPDSLADLDNFDGDGGLPRLFYFGSVGPRAFSKRVGASEHDFDAGERFETLLPQREHPDLRCEELINASDEEARAMFPRLTAKFPRGMRAAKLS